MAWSRHPPILLVTILLVTAPPSLLEVEAVPHGRTAQRLIWPHLPPQVRALVEQRFGERVVEAESQGSGFTPGFASRLTGDSGGRLFVKAASKQAQRQFAESYAEEARKLAALPTDQLPVPRLRWSAEDDRWVVLGFDCVEGRPPRRPWRPTELDRCLETLQVVAEVLGPQAPRLRRELALRPLVEDIPALVTGWPTLAAADPTWAAWPHLEEVGSLADSFARLPGAGIDGDVVHSDGRDDNFLITGDQALLCDWNWPALAPRWVDVVDLLVSAHGDGVDADQRLHGHPVTAGVPAEHIDAWLAALLGFMLVADTRPVPQSSPFLGVHRRWYAAALWSWLASRRGW